MANDAPIMLAEDEESDVLLLRMALERAGLANELIVAHDGQEAVDYLARLASHADPALHPFPGLLILDIKMPNLSGFDVLKWLAEHPEFKHLPVVMLTSSTHESDMRRALQLGARGFYIKPTGLNALVELLQRLHTRWLLQEPVDH